MKFMQKDCRKYIKRLSDSLIILPRPSTDFAKQNKDSQSRHMTCTDVVIKLFTAGSKMNFLQVIRLPKIQAPNLNCLSSDEIVSYKSKEIHTEDL